MGCNNKKTKLERRFTKTLLKQTLLKGPEGGHLQVERGEREHHRGRGRHLKG